MIKPEDQETRGLAEDQNIIKTKDHETQIAWNQKKTKPEDKKKIMKQKRSWNKKTELSWNKKIMRLEDLATKRS